MTGPIVNSYKNGNELSLMSNWFGEPTISEIFEELDARLSTISN
jgi:hypothetical protein